MTSYLLIQLSNTYIDTEGQQQAIVGAFDKQIYMKVDNGSCSGYFELDGTPIPKFPTGQLSTVIDASPQNLPDWAV